MLPLSLYHVFAIITDKHIVSSIFFLLLPNLTLFSQRHVADTPFLLDAAMGWKGDWAKGGFVARVN